MVVTSYGRNKNLDDEKKNEETAKNIPSYRLAAIKNQYWWKELESLLRPRRPLSGSTPEPKGKRIRPRNTGRLCAGCGETLKKLLKVLLITSRSLRKH